MYAGMTDARGQRCRLYDGQIRFHDAEGKLVDVLDRHRDYSKFIGEATLPNSYLKAPYLQADGFPEGVYRVGPLARLNVADSLRNSGSRRELEEFRQRFGRVPQARSCTTTRG